ncbi:MAG: ATP-binding cassette domain-containing protein, partial [Gemmatimonadetes bacterium]|nr:ATP-binding cassette domain-containing protein [Gemmatimonadota bacterium]
MNDSPTFIRSNDMAIELRGVTYCLESGRALIDSLDLTVEQGEMLILLGRSGAGKSTSLRLINGLLA